MRGDSFMSREDRSGQQSDGFPAPSRDAVYYAAMTAVREQGFVPDPNLSKRELGRIESRWHLSLSPFSGQGHRDKVRIRVLPVQDRPDFYRLDTNVIRQMNDNIAEPSNPIAAEWGEGKRRTDLETLINHRVELKFLPADVSPEFRRKYGMPGVESPRVQAPPPPKKKQGGFLGLPFP
jgi:hypothetical protein